MDTKYVITLVFFLLFMIIATVTGCSDFLLHTDSPGIVISGRTMDWFEKEGVKGSFMVEIRDQEWSSLSSVNPRRVGIAWENRYGFVGVESSYPQIAGFPESRVPQYVETLNEEGLSAAFLTLMDSQYPTTITSPDKALFYMDVVSYIAGNFRTVEEVKNGLQEVEIWCPPELAGKDPTHLIVHDALGRTLIVEWVKNETGVAIMNMYDGLDVDSRGGVLTNDPAYPYQLENLAFYSNCSPQNSFSGLPGGPSPEDRFVRLTKLNQYNVPIRSGNDTNHTSMVQAFHLLNTIEVVHGEYPILIEDNGTMSEVQFHTQFSVVRDHANRIYYVKTLTNQNIGMIDLKKLDFVSGRYRTLTENPYPDEAYDFTGSFSRSGMTREGTGMGTCDVIGYLRRYFS
ncbi:MAG: linear amide C-N hydrolase [Methanoregulaceae archaeon PtaB.Bin108]|nr:MAG: linear amide C-N hydrolase [Methanoregulaceae archaeon PtaB.Bin108]OPY41836.1 MAG: linear amide C-N hydrolase [Methanoregulaceae archaeon PtaU1.Bin222]